VLLNFGGIFPAYRNILSALGIEPVSIPVGPETNFQPAPELLDKILPIDADDDKPRHALVSTSEGTYHNVPDDDTLNLLRSRCDRLHEIHKEAPPGGYIDIEFKA